MSKKSGWHKTLEELSALDESYARQPDRPVALVREEARELQQACKRFGRALVAGTRVDKKLLGALADRRVLLDELDAAWREELASHFDKPARKARKQADTLRRDVAAALRYFLADDASVQAQVDGVLEGSGLSDLVDDLEKLAPLVERHQAQLAGADLDANAPARARQLAEQLKEARAKEKTEAALASALAARNRSFWWLREAMDEIRAAGRYVFRHEPKRFTLFRAATPQRAKPRAVAPAVSAAR